MPKTKAADRLISLVLAERCEFFPDSDGDAWVTVERGGHRETLLVEGAVFKGWLTNLFRNAEKISPTLDTINTARNQFAAWAQSGPTYDPPLRVAEHDNAIYLDLGDPSWRAIKVDTTGWNVITDVPVRFRRAPSMQALPEPQSGGKIEELRPFLNVKSDNAFVLRVAFLLNCLNPNGTHAILMLNGTGGSSKTGDATRMRALIDPYSIKPQRLKDEARDIYVGALHQALPVYDNLIRLSGEQSETLCQILTGGGYLERKLHTNKEVSAIKAKRPVIATAVKNPITAPDLADRAILDNLNPITPARRRAERELDPAFAKAVPRILGALLDGVAKALCRRDSINPGELPRLADFANFAIAAETAYWDEGTFMDAFAGGRVEAVTETVMDDEAMAALVTLMEAREEPFEQHLQNLLTALSTQVGERTAKATIWPQRSKQLQYRLKRMKAFLDELGIRFKYDRDRDGAIIRIWDWKRDPPMEEPRNSKEPFYEYKTDEPENPDDLFAAEPATTALPSPTAP